MFRIELTVSNGEERIFEMKTNDAFDAYDRLMDKIQDEEIHEFEITFAGFVGC